MATTAAWFLAAAVFEFGLSGVGFIAPGMTSWQAALPVLRGEQRYRPEPLPGLAPAILPANERRRASSMAKLCLSAAEGAMPTEGSLPALGGAVFASSSSDVQIAHKICWAVQLPGHPVSPTDFHNSVHNAASGYWSIATGQNVPINSITADNACFSAGLLEAVVMLENGYGAVLLVCFEYPPPAPLDLAFGLGSAAAVALLLNADDCRWRLQLAGPARRETRCSPPDLETLRLENPAMRALPFLSLLVTDSNDCVVLPYVNDNTLQVSRLA